MELPPFEEDVLKDWVRAMRGLTSTEAARSLHHTFTVHNREINDEALQYLQSVKRSIIKQTGIMEFHEPSTSFNDIGGLSNLVDDLILRRDEFEDDAQDAGIKAPKGCLLVVCRALENHLLHSLLLESGTCQCWSSTWQMFSIPMLAQANRTSRKSSLLQNQWLLAC